GGFRSKTLEGRVGPDPTAFDAGASSADRSAKPAARARMEPQLLEGCHSSTRLGRGTESTAGYRDGIGNYCRLFADGHKIPCCNRNYNATALWKGCGSMIRAEIKDACEPEIAGRMVRFQTAYRTGRAHLAKRTRPTGAYILKRAAQDCQALFFRPLQRDDRG